MNVAPAPLRLTWRRFRRDRAAVVGLALVVLLVLIAVFAPLLTDAIGAPHPGVRSPAALNAFGTPSGPSGAHLFGVDPLGRDIFSRVIYGGRASLLAAIAATLLAVLAGGLIGLLAGGLGGVAGAVLARLTDALTPFPLVLLAGGLAATCTIGDGCLGGVINPGVPVLIVVPALVFTAVVARRARAVAAAAASQFTAVARSAGASRARIIVREVRPNLSAPLLLAGTVILPQCVLLDATLSFLGVGAAGTTPSWGAMLQNATSIYSSAWWSFAFPGAALLITGLALTVLSDGVRRAVKPGRDG